MEDSSNWIGECIESINSKNLQDREESERDSLRICGALEILRVFLLSRISARMGSRREPPGRMKMMIMGRYKDKRLRWALSCCFSSLVHFWSVFLCLNRSCKKPCICWASLNINSLFLKTNLFSKDRNMETILTFISLAKEEES